MRILKVISLLIGFNQIVWAHFLVDDVTKDIAVYRKDHVERFKDLVALRNSLDNHGQVLHEIKEQRKNADQKALELLLGLKGIKKGPKNEARYQQQVLWATDFIQRQSFRLIPYNTAFSQDNPFLDSIQKAVHDFGKLNDQLLQHISFSVLNSLITFWYADHDFAKNPILSNVPLIDFIHDVTQYASLGAYSEQFHQYIKNNFKKDDDLSDHLKKTDFESLWEENKKYLLTPQFNFSEVNIKYSLAGEHRENFNTVFKPVKPKSPNKPFDVHVKGTIKGTKGDGTCYYHAIRSAVEAIQNWNEEGCAKKSREYFAKLIEENIDNPLIRFWSAVAAQHKIEVEPTLVFKGLNDQDVYKKSSPAEKERFLYQQKSVQNYVNTIIRSAAVWGESGSPNADILAYLNQWHVNVITFEIDNTQITRKFKILPKAVKNFWLIHHTNHFMYMEDPELQFKAVDG